MRGAGYRGNIIGIAFYLCLASALWPVKGEETAPAVRATPLFFFLHLAALPGDLCLVLSIRRSRPK